MFYIRLDDPINTGFVIDDTAYQHAVDLRLDNPDLDLEFSYTKWTKNLKFSVFLTPSFDLEYDLKDQEENLANDQKFSKTLIDSRDLFQCYHQTVNFEGSIFCFDKKFYRFLKPIEQIDRMTSKDDQYTIDSIFLDVNFKFQDQILEFIINHPNDESQLIFMTQTHLFIFYYKSFVVYSSTKQIFFDEQQRLPVEVIDNCIFRSCIQPATTEIITYNPYSTKTTTISTSINDTETTEETEMTSHKKQIDFNNLQLLLIFLPCALIITFILILIIALAKRCCKDKLASSFSQTKPFHSKQLNRKRSKQRPVISLNSSYKLKSTVDQTINSEELISEVNFRKIKNGFKTLPKKINIVKIRKGSLVKNSNDLKKNRRKNRR